jgi:hypothetical protein
MGKIKPILNFSSAIAPVQAKDALRTSAFNKNRFCIENLLMGMKLPVFLRAAQLSRILYRVWRLV